jgi:nucleotide-binding universal stress UspA family protein
LRQNRLEVETHIFEGEPKKVLLKQVAKWNADCLFVGAHGLQHGRHLFLGSLAAAVATRAACSVEIVRVPTQR